MFDIRPSDAVIDLSFISLSLVLPVIKKLLGSDGDVSVICLIKPQFEAGRDKVGKKGVVSDPEIHKNVLENFCRHSTETGFIVKGLTHSPIKGPQGNIEYLGFLCLQGDSEVIDCGEIVKQAHEELNV
jgi:23S rRNA (cytidine1920-2'-O)/16S rRNA (cytidine1409-2'-O)-methyltransferase